MFEYLTALRMQRAQVLLRNSDLPLHEVAHRIGYESDPAFAKAFKRLLGVFFDDVSGQPPQAYKLSVLGIPFPSLSYSFKF